MRTSAYIATKRRRTGRWLVGILAIIGVGLLAATFSFHQQAPAASTKLPAMPHGVALGSWEENGHDGRYLLQVVDGNALSPNAQLTGVVATDTDCTPDAGGFSHCHNIIDLANHMRITVIDTHLMNRYRCLRPGETVSLTGLDSTWILAVTGLTASPGNGLQL